MKQTAFILFVLGAICSGGCREDGRLAGPEQPGPQRYGKLPGLKETPDKNLRDEFARIVDEGGTPELLTKAKLPDGENVAAGLARLFPNSRVKSIFDKSEEIYPKGRFTFNPIQLEKAIKFRKLYDHQRRQARAALDREECDFSISFELGFSAELPFVDVVRLCARLEAFRAAELLSDDDPAAAVESLRYMLRLSECLAAQKHPTTRLQAAMVRAEALGVLQYLVENPATTGEDLGRSYDLVRGSLKSWPPDADAWIGDRALGMHSYELVRAGHIVKLLTEEEVERFSAEGILAELPAAAVRKIDQDELYYLETMRKVIDDCSRPYYGRVKLFEQIRNELHQRRNSPGFPLVAGRLLLPDIEKGHVIQAQDRASCEAWALALASAAGRKPPPYQVNPLTGKQYRVVRDGHRVAVGNVAADDDADNPPIVVPDLAEQPAHK